jgi:hypothetical protein
MTNWKGHRRNNQHILVDIIHDYDKGTKENLGTRLLKPRIKPGTSQTQCKNIRINGFWTLSVVPYTTKQ